MSTFAFRYGILEDFGPQSITYYDLKMIFVNFLPMILAVIVSIVFNALTLRNVLIHRRKRQDGDATERSNPPILKYLLLTNSSSVLMIFGNGWALYSYTKYYLLQINDHELYPDLFVPISEVMETIHKKFFLTRFMMDVNPDGVIINGGFFVTIPIVGMYFFAFFGLGAEARKMHRENVKWVAHLLGWRQEGKEEEECPAPKQSHGFLQKKIFLSIFKRVLPSNRNRRVPVDPFELPSNTSSQCLEKGVLDVGPNTAGKVGRTDQVLADPPPRRSMHKSPLPPSLPSPSTPIEGGKAQRYSAVTPVQDEPPPFLPLSSTVTDGVVPTGLRSLLRPQRKPPLPPPSHHANSIGNGEQSHPQSLALPVPPPAYTPETLSRERQYWDMTAFYNLPAEGTLQVLAHLRMPDLYTFQRICSHFHLVIKQNEASVYRSAAIFHGYVSKSDPPATVEEALELQRCKGWWVDEQAQTWKDLCRSCWTMDSGWTRSAIAKETVIWELGHSFSRVSMQQGLVLIQNQDLRNIFVISSKDLERYDSLGSWATIDNIETRPFMVASDGQFMLFKKSARIYTIYWQSKDYASWKRNKGVASEVEPEGGEGADEPNQPVDVPHKFAKHLAELCINTNCEALKMKDGYLMMVTSHPTLYIFDLNTALAAANSDEEAVKEGSTSAEEDNSGEPSMESPTLKPSAKRDFLFTVEHTSIHHFVATKCIDFDDQYIFHCTDVGFRIVCRSTFKVLYTVHEAPWQKTLQSPVRWAKCITSNAYAILPPAATSVSYNPRTPPIHQLRVVNEVIKLVEGTAVTRKDAPWRWDAIGFPDYRKLISKEWDINDRRGCWLIDIGRLCNGTVFDGRRLVIDAFDHNLILNVHELSEKSVSSGTPVVRLSRHAWKSTGPSANTMILTNRSLSFLGSY
ncbi:9202_t:CDS:2, partial [Acaulospora colombiana]